jgi:hypothetical protein
MRAIDRSLRRRQLLAERRRCSQDYQDRSLSAGPASARCPGASACEETWSISGQLDPPPIILSCPRLRGPRRMSGPAVAVAHRSQRPGAPCFSSDAKCGLASIERPAPQFAAVEPDQFGSLSLVVRVEPPIVWLGQGLLRLAALVSSGSVSVGTIYPVERGIVCIF